MNWLLFAIIAVAIILAIIGYIRGFSKMLISAAALILSVVLTWILVPPIQRLVIEHTKIESKLVESLENGAFSSLQEDEEIDRKLTELPIPAGLKEKIRVRLDALTPEMGRRAALARMTADLILTASIAILLFILIRIVIEIIAKLLDLVNKIPGIKQANAILGAVLGLIEAWLIISLLFLLIMIIGPTSVGAVFRAKIEESYVLSWLYDNNLLIYLFHVLRVYV